MKISDRIKPKEHGPIGFRRGGYKAHSGPASRTSESSVLHAFERIFRPNSERGAQEMLAQKIRLPDIDPAIAQAEATAAAPLSSAFKAAAFSIGAMILLLVLSGDWSQLSKLGRSHSVEVSAAVPLEPR